MSEDTAKYIVGSLKAPTAVCTRSVSAGSFGSSPDCLGNCGNPKTFQRLAASTPCLRQLGTFTKSRSAFFLFPRKSRKSLRSFKSQFRKALKHARKAPSGMPCSPGPTEAAGSWAVGCRGLAVVPGELQLRSHPAARPPLRGEPRVLHITAKAEQGEGSLLETRALVRQCLKTGAKPKGRFKDR